MTVEMDGLPSVGSWCLVGFWRLDKYSAAIKGILVENEIEQHVTATQKYLLTVCRVIQLKYTPDNWKWVISHIYGASIHTYLSAAPTINITAQFSFK
jgi:hypothetical protein